MDSNIPLLSMSPPSQPIPHQELGILGPATLGETPWQPHPGNRLGPSGFLGPPALGETPRDSVTEGGNSVTVASSDYTCYDSEVKYVRAHCFRSVSSLNSLPASSALSSLKVRIKNTLENKTRIVSSHIAPKSY